MKLKLGTYLLKRKESKKEIKAVFVCISYCPVSVKNLFYIQFHSDALGIILSALYGKLLVVMGIAFPMSEVISTYIPPSFYDVSIFIGKFRSLNITYFKVCKQCIAFDLNLHVVKSCVKN